MNLSVAMLYPGLVTFSNAGGVFHSSLQVVVSSMKHLNGPRTHSGQASSVVGPVTRPRVYVSFPRG